MKKLIVVFLLLTGAALAQSVSLSGGVVVGGNSNGSGFDPFDLTQSIIVDEFAGGSTSTNQIGNLGWQLHAASGTATGNGTPYWGEPGVINLNSGSAGAGNYGNISLGTNASVKPMGALGSTANWSAVFRFKLGSTTLSNMKVGFSSNVNQITTSINDGFWIKYDAGESVFTVQTCVTGTCTSGTTTYALDTNFHKISIRSTSAGSIIFSFDGGPDQTLSTNVSTATMTPFFGTHTGEAVNKILYVDYFAYKVTGLSR
jgi:hypothetical protein